MRPPAWRNPRPRDPYHLLVIGAGPAGLVAARGAAALGARVALVERHLLGGDCLNYGCVPSKTLIRTSRLYAEMRNAVNYGARRPDDIVVDFPLAMERMRRIRTRISRVDSAARLAADGIDVFFGTARFVGGDAVDVDGTRLRFKKALIATGSRSMLPSIPGLAEAGFLTNETVFDLTELPRSLLVIGGGPLGCELAQAFCRFGTRTVIAHDVPLFLPKEERDAAQLLAEALARDGVEIHLNTRAVNVRVDGGQKCIETVNDGNVATIVVDQILTGIGRVPTVDGLDLEAAGVEYDVETGVHVDDFLRTSNRRIYAAGDVCLEHKFTDTADASARIVVQNALFARPQAHQRADDPVVHLHRPGDRPRRHLCEGGARARHPGQDLHGADARGRPRDRRRRGGRLRQDPRARRQRHDPRRHGGRAPRRRDDQRHLAGDGRRHRPAHRGPRDPRLPDAGRGAQDGGQRLHAHAAVALAGATAAPLGRALISSRIRSIKFTRSDGVAAKAAG